MRHYFVWLLLIDLMEVHIELTAMLMYTYCMKHGTDNNEKAEQKKKGKWWIQM